MLGPCWHYVGSFFALGRLFFTLERLSHVCWAFFYSRSTFFARFGWLRVGCLGIQGQFRGSETTFFGVLSSAQVCNAKKLRMCKNHTFSCVFLYGFYILRALSSSHKTTQNHSRGLFNRASCKDCAPIASWGGFWKGLVFSGASLDRLLFALGRLLVSLGPFLGVSWAFLDALGCLLPALWSFTAAFRLPGPSQASILKGLGTSQTEF